jgi:tetratricopeptide (TPR) repeat protein
MRAGVPSPGGRRNCRPCPPRAGGHKGGNRQRLAYALQFLQKIKDAHPKSAKMRLIQICIFLTIFNSANMSGANIKRLAPVLLLLVATCATAQREVLLRRTIQVRHPNSMNYLDRCDYMLLVPASRPGRQHVLEYKYNSLKPAGVIKNAHKEYYLKWSQVSFARLKDSVMEVTMKIKLYRYDLATARAHPAPDKKDLDTLPYLQDEENFRCWSKPITEVAEKIEGSTREEVAKNIFEFVKEKLDYKIFFFQDRGAKQALKDGEGDCTEYSELMVTLCRAKKIPARIVKGLIPHYNGTVGRHNWVEVFFPGLGWVAFDPTFADSPKGNTTFYSMPNTYIELGARRFIETVISPCRGADIPFTLSLKDSTAELTRSFNTVYKNALVYYQASENEKARSLLDTLIRMQPDAYTLRNLRAVLRARLGQFDSAQKDLQLAMKTAESDKERKFCHYACANYYALKGDSLNAVKSLREAFDLGFDDMKHLRNDPDFEKVKSYPPFRELLDGHATGTKPKED